MRHITPITQLSLAIGAALLVTHAEAASITWTNNVGGFGSTTTGVADIPTIGSYVDAVYFPGPSTPMPIDQTVGTDVFHPGVISVNNVSSPSGDITLAYPNTPLSTGPGVSPLGYGTVLSNGLYTSNSLGAPNGAPIVISFNNLAPKTIYQAQIWVTQHDNSGYQMTLTAGNSITLKAQTTAASAAGQFALGEFTNFGTSVQTESLNLVITAPGGNPFPFLNAVALREIGTVPEPGSVVLMAVGLIGICIAARRLGVFVK